VDDAVIEAATILDVQIPVSLASKPILDVREAILLAVNDAIVERLECVESLVSIEDKKTPRLFLDEEDARNGKPEQEGLDETVGLCSRPDILALEANDLGFLVRLPTEARDDDVVANDALD